MLKGLTAYFAGQLRGTTTNDSANAGNLGELLSTIVLFGAPIALSTGSSLDITSRSLTAGDWDVWAVAQYLGNGATTVTALTASISATQDTLDTTSGRYACVTPGGAAIFAAANNATGPTVTVGPVRISLAVTTTLHLVANASFGVNTLAAFGGIFARRCR